VAGITFDGHLAEVPFSHILTQSIRTACIPAESALSRQLEFFFAYRFQSEFVIWEYMSISAKLLPLQISKKL
jgi:hypothetical protein